MQKYKINYTITGIYGEVTIDKEVDTNNFEELFKNSITSIETGKGDLDQIAKFQVKVCDDKGEVLNKKEIIINGLPNGISEERYFRMGRLRKINELETVKEKLEKKIDFAHGWVIAEIKNAKGWAMVEAELMDLYEDIFSQKYESKVKGNEFVGE